MQAKCGRHIAGDMERGDGLGAEDRSCRVLVEAQTLVERDEGFQPVPIAKVPGRVGFANDGRGCGRLLGGGDVVAGGGPVFFEVCGNGVGYAIGGFEGG